MYGVPAFLSLATKSRACGGACVLAAEDDDDPRAGIDEVVAAGVGALGVPARDKARVVQCARSRPARIAVRGVDRRSRAAVVPVGVLARVSQATLGLRCMRRAGGRNDRVENRLEPVEAERVRHLRSAAAVAGDAKAARPARVGDAERQELVVVDPLEDRRGPAGEVTGAGVLAGRRGKPWTHPAKLHDHEAVRLQAADELRREVARLYPPPRSPAAAHEHDETTCGRGRLGGGKEAAVRLLDARTRHLDSLARGAGRARRVGVGGEREDAERKRRGSRLSWQCEWRGRTAAQGNRH